MMMYCSIYSWITHKDISLFLASLRDEASIGKVVAVDVENL